MKTTFLTIAIALNAAAQTPVPAEKKPAFEVASIRTVKNDGNHDSDSDRGFYKTHNLSLKRLVAIAYGVDARLVIGGPPWVDDDGFDISAKIPSELAQREQETVPLMLQSLLAERFGLVTSRQTRDTSAYALVVAKKGAKMAPAKPGADGSTMNSRNTHLVATNVTMAKFAKSISRDRDIGMLVIDKTGLTGSFDFELDWKPEALAGKAEASNDDRPGIFTALQEQLGLRLESTRAPIEAIVIDHAEKPGDN